MRLLACFSRNRVVLDHADPLARVNNKNHRNEPKFERATKPVADPNVFVPTSIPELHPEYAHSEPYCFAARTDSARFLVQKMRDVKGQPAPDRAEILKDQGLVIVRGPSYNAKKAAEKAAPDAANNQPVPLTVETPSTADQSYAESDDSGRDENANSENIAMQRNSSASQSRKLFDSKTATSQTAKQENARSKKSPGKPFRLISRKSKNSLKRNITAEQNVLQPRDSNVTDYDTDSIQERSSYPTPPASDHSSESTEVDLQKHMDNTPKELLAPIMVPRMSGAFDSKNILSANTNPTRPIAESPAISNDSWGPTDSSQRYEDVEGDNSSSFVAMSAVGKQKVIHKATYSPARGSQIRSTLQDTSSQSTVSHSMRSRRKSKPFLPSTGTIETSAPTLAGPETSPSPVLGDRLDDTEVGSIPEPVALSRQISLGALSDDIQVVDTSALSSSDNKLVPVSTPSPKEAAMQRINDEYLDLPKATAQQQGIIRRASSTKRKTVSFHTASPTIIEPNLRAPSSVPRSALLSKETRGISEASRKQASALRNARDSVALASSPVPKTMSTATLTIDRRQDSFTSDESFQERSSRRLSTRVMVKDRNELREASKRQSRAVAAAMADQIRGVPKSAMLAFSENEVEIAESFEGSEQDSSLSSLRRRSRASKSIRMPEIIPGVVPPPPPPPPFVPDMPRARSIRTPPPPPASPLRY